MRTSTQTIYEGSKACPCGKIITPLEAMYSRDGLCGTCHKKRVQNLINNGMVQED